MRTRNTSLFSAIADPCTTSWSLSRWCSHQDVSRQPLRGYGLHGRTNELRSLYWEMMCLDNQCFTNFTFDALSLCVTVWTLRKTPISAAFTRDSNFPEITLDTWPCLIIGTKTDLLLCIHRDHAELCQWLVNLIVPPSVTRGYHLKLL